MAKPMYAMSEALTEVLVNLVYDALRIGRYENMADHKHFANVCTCVLIRIA